MPFGAHETLEVHEILLEKVNVITHFNLYLQEAQDPELRDLIMRHRQEEIRSYDEIVAYTHDYNAAAPVPSMTHVKGISPQNIQYGLNNPPQVGPRTGAALGDTEIASAVLCAHKNAAKNGIWAALETADPNLRRMLLNSATNCANQAYEVFLFMNKQGTYQVPKMSSHTAKTYLHTYQPAGQAFQNQYSGQTGFSGHTPGAGGGMNQNFNPASQQSGVYGALQGNRNAQYGMNGNLPNQGMQGYSK